MLGKGKTHLPNGGCFMVIYHSKEVKKHLKQIQGNGTLSRFIARIDEKTHLKKINLVHDENCMTTQRNGISTTKSKPDDLLRIPGSLKLNISGT